MVVAASPRVYIRRCPHSDFSLLPLEGGAPKGRRLALGFLPSNIRGGQPRLAPLVSPFQRKGREDGLDVARSLKLAVFSYHKPNPQLLISSHQSLPLVFPFPHAIINLGKYWFNRCSI